MVHRLEYNIDPKTKEVAKDYQRWVVQKNRTGRRREFYFEEDIGVLKLRDNQQVFPNCTAQLVNVLRDYFLHIQEEVSKGEANSPPLVDEIEISLLTMSKKDKSAARSYTDDNCGNRNNDSTPLHPLSTVVVSVGEEQSTKLNNDKFFEHEKGVVAYSL